MTHQLDRLLDGNNVLESDEILSLLPILLKQGIFSQDKINHFTKQLIEKIKNGNSNPKLGPLISSLGQFQSQAIGEGYWNSVVNVLMDIEPIPLSLIESISDESFIGSAVKRLLSIMFEKENTAQEEQKLASTVKRIVGKISSSNDLKFISFQSRR